jgi:hypothetical protein
LWRLDDFRIVDATFCGNMARFINHCHSPNCFVDIVSVNGENKVIVSALRDIKAGEELNYDYCFDGDNVPCDCGYFDFLFFFLFFEREFFNFPFRAISCPGFMNLPPLPTQ